VDTETATSLKGLYAAGDVACVPVQYLSGAFVYGEIAGQSAAKYAEKCNTREIDHELIQKQADKMFAQLDRSDGIKPKDFELKLRNMITEYLAPPRNAEKLETALKWIKKFRNEDVENLIVEDLHELGKAVEARFILDCAEMTARSALKRKETRWGKSDYRSDFPERDDENWLKFVDLKMDQKTGEMTIFTSPIRRKESQGAKMNELLSVEIDRDSCNGCGICMDICPLDCFRLDDDIYFQHSFFGIDGRLRESAGQHLDN